MRVPVCLLDIDGVINSFSVKAPTQMHKGRWRTGSHTWQGRDLALLWAQPVIDWIVRTHQMKRMEFWWHTSWQDDAPTFGRLVGLPEFPVLPCPEFARFEANGSKLAGELIRDGLPGWWKFPAAMRVVTDWGRPVVWIDDELAWQVRDKHRIEVKKLVPALFVSPDRFMGLSNKDMMKVEQFLEGLEEARGALSGS